MNTLARLRAAGGGAPVRHPLAATARAHGVGAGHLGAIDARGGRMLPVLLLRAGLSARLQRVPGGIIAAWAPFHLDARALPHAGPRSRFRGLLKLDVEPTTLEPLAARVEGLDWREAAGGAWRCVPPARHGCGGGPGGCAEEIGWHLAAWGLTPDAAAPLAAAFRGGAEEATRTRPAGLRPGGAGERDRDAAVLGALAEAFAARAGTGGQHPAGPVRPAARVATRNLAADRPRMARNAFAPDAPGWEREARLEAAAPALLAALERLLAAAAPGADPRNLAGARAAAERALAAAGVVPPLRVPEAVGMRQQG